MKKISITLFLTFLASLFVAQNVIRQSIGTIGGSSSLTSSYTIQHSTGQPYSTQSADYFTQGFIQPKLSSIPYSDTYTNNKLTIYPNPASTSFTLNNKIINYNSVITVVNSFGGIILKRQYNVIDNLILDCSNWASGTYIVKLTNDRGQTYFSKFLKI